MSLAKFRKVYGKNGSGRFVVSEGTAPSAYLLTNPALPTLYTDLEDNRFEIVIPKGTILSVVADANGDSTIVPCNGTSYAQSYSDGGASPQATVLVAPHSTPIGCAQYDLYRPFDKGTSQGAGWITEGYVEWPLVAGLNDDLAVGDRVRSDSLGRPVKWASPSDAVSAATPSVSNDVIDIVGKVIEIETFATNFDDGLLSYMLLPSDPGALKLVYELSQAGTYTGKLGIRANLDVANVTGAFRVVLGSI